MFNFEVQVDAAFKEEEPVGTADSVVTEVNEVPDNAILRKLLVCIKMLCVLFWDKFCKTSLNFKIKIIPLTLNMY